MACACKVNQQLDYIQKKYGTKQPPLKKRTHIIESIKAKFKNIFYYMLIIPFTPLMVLFLIKERIKGTKSINIEKTFNLKQNV